MEYGQTRRLLFSVPFLPVRISVPLFMLFVLFVAMLFLTV